MRKLIYYYPYFGGKLRLVGKITLMVPKNCSTLLEVCGGSGAFILNRYRWFKQAIYNEYNGRICNLFRLMQDKSTRDELVERLVNIDYDKEKFYKFKKDYEDNFKEIKDRIAQAEITYRLITQSFNNEKKNWVKKTIGKNNMRNTRTRLLKVGNALENIIISQEDCFNLIDKYKNDSGVFILADVPYPHGTRTSDDSYGKGFEWSDEMHERFALLIAHMQAKCMLCTYESEIYNRILVDGAKWKKIKIAELPSPSDNKQGLRNRKSEYIYINYTSYSRLAKYLIAMKD